MRAVGTRKEKPLQFHASGEALIEGALFCEALAAFRGARVARKGVRRYKTHELANRDSEADIARSMAAGKSEE